MKAKDLMKQLEGYEDFELVPRVHLEVAEEELQKRAYKLPYDTYDAKIEVQDIGHSDKVVLLRIEPIGDI